MRRKITALFVVCIICFSTPHPYLAFAADDVMISISDITGDAAPGYTEHYDVPFTTDADVILYRNDTSGIIKNDKETVIISYPRIKNVIVDSNQCEMLARSAGAVRIALAPGKHEIVIERAKRNEAISFFGTVTETISEGSILVSTLSEFNAVISDAKPGDEIVIQDGIYENWITTINANGTSEAPIVIRPQTPGGAAFTGSMIRFDFYGSFIEFKGFTFESAYYNLGNYFNVIHLGLNSHHNRVTQNLFIACGKPDGVALNVIQIDRLANSNRVDHNYFTMSNSISIAQRVNRSFALAESVGCDNHIENNIFRNIFPHSGNGQENIQLGQGGVMGSGADKGTDSSLAEARAVVEYNVFNNTYGDNEIISNKSSENIIRRNIATYNENMEAGFWLRGGVNVLFEGNVSYMCNNGVTIIGDGHKVINNLFIDPTSGRGVRYNLGLGLSKNVLLANNTFVNAGVNVDTRNAESGIVATGHRMYNNMFINGKIPNTVNTHMNSVIISNNLFYPIASEVEGDNSIHSDPLFILDSDKIHTSIGTGSPAIGAGIALDEVATDRWGNIRTGTNTDIGADLAGGEQNLPMPDIPGKMSYDFDSLREYKIYSLDIEEEEGGTLYNDVTHTVSQLLPVDFTWEFEGIPLNTESKVSFNFNLDGLGHGYRLEMGNSITLSKLGGSQSRTAVSVSNGGTVGLRLVKNGGKILVEMKNAYVGGVFTPVILWEDSEIPLNGGTSNLTLNGDWQIQKVDMYGGQKYRSGKSIMINTAISDSTDIDRVEFYTGGRLIGVDSSFPYTFECNNLMQGNYSVKVKAVMSSGQVYESAETAVNVYPTVPQEENKLIIKSVDTGYGSITVHISNEYGQSVRARTDVSYLDNSCNIVRAASIEKNIAGNAEQELLFMFLGSVPCSNLRITLYLCDETEKISDIYNSS